jgi:hypothetical protein
MQIVRSLHIEALDDIVQGLALHAGQSGGLGPGMPSRALAIASNRRIALGSFS